MRWTSAIREISRARRGGWTKNNNCRKDATWWYTKGATDCVRFRRECQWLRVAGLRLSSLVCGEVGWKCVAGTVRGWFCRSPNLLLGLRGKNCEVDMSCFCKRYFAPIAANFWAVMYSINPWNAQGSASPMMVLPPEIRTLIAANVSMHQILRVSFLWLCRILTVANFARHPMLQTSAM